MFMFAPCPNISIPFQLCHAKPWHSADPVQGTGFGYERSLLLSVKTKPKTIAKLLTFSISFSSLCFHTFCVFSWDAAVGAAIRALLYVCSSSVSLRDAERMRGASMSPAFPHLQSHLCTLTFPSLEACSNLSCSGMLKS